MKSMSQHMVLLLAVALSVSACAKKKDGGSSSSEAKNTSPAPADPKDGVPIPGSTTTTTTTTTTTLTTLPGGTPPFHRPTTPPTPTTPGVPGKGGTPAAPAPDDKDNKGNGKGGKGSGKNGGKDAPPPNTHSKPEGGGEIKPPPATPPQPPPLPPTTGGGTAGGPNHPPAPPTGPGTQIDESNRYTGSAPDSLRDVLIQQQYNVAPDQLIRNKNLAQKITSATLKIDRDGLFQMNLVLGSEKTIGFAGRLVNGSDTLATNAVGASGTLTCLDAVADQYGFICETSLATVNYKKATVQVIFRRTNVHMLAEFNVKPCMSKACEHFYYLFRKTDLYILDENTFKAAFMDSYEVIHGKSEFRLLARTNEQQVFKIAGILAGPAYQPMDVPTNRLLTAQELVDPATGQLGRTQINESLGNVRLVQNDGQGRLNFFVQMPLLDNGERDVFQIQVTRKVKQVRLPEGL